MLLAWKGVRRQAGEIERHTGAGSEDLSAFFRSLGSVPAQRQRHLSGPKPKRNGGRIPDGKQLLNGKGRLCG